MAGISSIATHPQRALIDAALVAGQSPHQIHAQHGEALGVSRSSVYRYAASRRSPLAPRWVDPTTTVQEAADDLGQVRRDLMRRFDTAMSDATAARLAREISQVSSVLKKDFDAASDDETPDDNSDVADLLVHVLKTLPGALHVARNYHRLSVPLAADLDALAQYVASKEN